MIKVSCGSGNHCEATPICKACGTNITTEDKDLLIDQGIKSAKDIIKKYHLAAGDFHNSVVGTYLEFDSPESRLDGIFNSDELRRIADAMDALKILHKE